MWPFPRRSKSLKAHLRVSSVLAGCEYWQYPIRYSRKSIVPELSWGEKDVRVLFIWREKIKRVPKILNTYLIDMNERTYSLDMYKYL